MTYLKIRFAAWRERVWTRRSNDAIQAGDHALMMAARWRRFIDRLRGKA
ncbi:hypothetical protein WDZ11_14670 [Roseomonas mucosa]